MSVIFEWFDFVYRVFLMVTMKFNLVSHGCRNAWASVLNTFWQNKKGFIIFKKYFLSTYKVAYMVVDLIKCQITVSEVWWVARWCKIMHCKSVATRWQNRLWMTNPKHVCHRCMLSVCLLNEIIWSWFDQQVIFQMFNEFLLTYSCKKFVIISMYLCSFGIMKINYLDSIFYCTY